MSRIALLVVLSAIGCNETPSAPKTAQLSITIDGLPAGVQPAVVVTGPDSFRELLAASRTLSSLAGGTYTIAATEVTSFSRRVTSSSTFGNLEAGSYTVSADVVASAFTTHTPSPAVQTVSVADGGTSTAVVAYGSSALALSLKLVADGLTQPVFLTAPDGDARQFIVERGGRIRIVVNGALLATPLLDIRSRVNNAGERGMLSMAFDPQYATTGLFYVYYVNLAGDVTVERFSSKPGLNTAGSSGGLVIIIPHGGSEHHGGLIAFGPDGMLYVAPGDGGCCGDPQNNAQNLNSLLGKMLRIDVRTPPYTIPAGNPFVGGGGGRAEIWAYGLRNPWRYSFDVPAGMLYIADVGNDVREEVNVARIGDAGLNYGWRYMEGLACFNPSTNCATGRSLTLPVFDYTHGDGCSITHGYVYRGAAIPELTGHYFFADYCRGWVRSFRVRGTLVTELTTWASLTTQKPVSFGRDSAGEMYIIGGTNVWMIVRQGS